MALLAAVGAPVSVGTLVVTVLTAVPLHAQITPELGEARRLYTVERAHLVGPDKTVLLAGEFYTTSHPYPGYKRRDAFLFQDYSKPGVQVDVYTNDHIPAANTQIWVRGHFVNRLGKAGKPIFVAEPGGIGTGAPLPPDSVASVNVGTASTAEHGTGGATGPTPAPAEHGTPAAATPGSGDGSNSGPENVIHLENADTETPPWQKYLLPGLLGVAFLGAIGVFLWQTFGTRKPTGTASAALGAGSGPQAGGYPPPQGGHRGGMGLRPGEIDPLTSTDPVPVGAGRGAAGASRQFPADPLTGDFSDPARSPSVRTSDMPADHHGSNYPREERMNHTDTPMPLATAQAEAPLPAPVPETAAGEGRLYFVEKVKPEELMANLGAAGSSGTPVAHGPFPAGTPFPAANPAAEAGSAAGFAGAIPAAPVTPLTPITPVAAEGAAVTPISPVAPLPATPTAGGVAMSGSVVSEAVSLPASTGGAPHHAVYSAPEGDDTVYSSDVRLLLLPAWFEVVNGGADGLDTPGRRLPLWSLDDNMVFGIARPTNNQDRIANFIPLLSRRVSRSVESQGDIVWDPTTKTATVRNFADPAQRKNPIRVQDRAMLVGEMRPLHDGDRLQIGDVILRFHATGGDRE